MTANARFDAGTGGNGHLIGRPSGGAGTSVWERLLLVARSSGDPRGMTGTVSSWTTASEGLSPT
jgi:hypothetical protein